MASDEESGLGLRAYFLIPVAVEMVKARTQGRNLEAGPEAVIMEDCCVLSSNFLI